MFKIGDVITIKYFEILKSGKPRFPIFLRTKHPIHQPLLMLSKSQLMFTIYLTKEQIISNLVVSNY